MCLEGGDKEQTVLKVVLKLVVATVTNPEGEDGGQQREAENLKLSEKDSFKVA